MTDGFSVRFVLARLKSVADQPLLIKVTEGLEIPAESAVLLFQQLNSQELCLGNRRGRAKHRKRCCLLARRSQMNECAESGHIRLNADGSRGCQ